MALHRFKMGQFVDFSPSRRDLPSSGRRYEIVRQMPIDGSEPQYRIKCKEEPYERIAKESELTRRA